MHNADGYPAPHLEMIRHEGSTMAMNYIHRIFAKVGKLPKYMGFDDMVEERCAVEHVFELHRVYFRFISILLHVCISW